MNKLERVICSQIKCPCGCGNTVRNPEIDGLPPYSHQIVRYRRCPCGSNIVVFDPEVYPPIKQEELATIEPWLMNSINRWDLLNPNRNRIRCVNCAK